MEMKRNSLRGVSVLSATIAIIMAASRSVVSMRTRSPQLPGAFATDSIVVASIYKQHYTGEHAHYNAYRYSGKSETLAYRNGFNGS